MNTKVTFISDSSIMIEADMSDVGFQYFYLRLKGLDDLADAVRSGTVTIEQSEQVLSGEMEWPMEQEEQAV